MSWLDISQIIFIALVAIIGMAWTAKIIFGDNDDKKE
jgi:hypothetical protein